MADEINEVIAQVASEGGAAEIQEFTEQRRIQYLDMLQQALNNLNAQYKSGRDLTSRKSIAEEIFQKKQQAHYEELKSKLQGVMKDEEHFQDDDVIIDPKRGTYISKNISEELQKIIQNQELENLKTVRANVYDLVEGANLTKATFEAMAVVLKLRAEIMQEQNMEEKIGITYEFNGEYYLLQVPMQEFLQNDKIIAAMDVRFKAISESRTSDPYQINFGSSVLSQMQNIWGNGQKLTNITTNRYKELITQQFQKIRETKKYIVTKQFTAQPGFVMEGLVEEFLLGTEYQYAQDNIPWFGKADIYDKEKRINISLKNLVDGSPTMVRLNSVHKVLQNLINYLSAPLPITKVEANIKSQIFNKLPKNPEEKVFYKLLEGTMFAGAS